jgi:hypothetical protein
LRLRAALTATVLLLVLPAAADARPDASSLSRTIDVGAGGATRTLACPRGGVALGGAVVAISPEVIARASMPSGISRWTYSFAGGPGKARVVLRCVRVRPTGGLRTSEVRVSTRNFDATVPANSSLRATLRCASGYVPTGYGVEQAQSGAATVAVARPGPRAWTFVLENEGNEDTRPTVHARCLVRAASASGPGGSASHPLVVRVASFGDRVNGGARRAVTHRCPAGHFSAGTGHSLPASDDIEATRNFVFRRRFGRWIFVNPGGGAEMARTFLTCLSLRTGFR